MKTLHNNIALSIILSIVFLSLALIHFNWAGGGKWGLENALPTNEQGEKVITPRSIDCAIVGIGLLFFSFFYLSQSSLFGIKLPLSVYKYGGLIIPSIFILRVIGDFKYVGLFKKIGRTDFGKYDTKYYIPLCLILGLMGFWLHFLQF